jgi:hypothetical protein
MMTPVNRPSHGINGRRQRRSRALLLQASVIARRWRHRRRRRVGLRRPGSDHHERRNSERFAKLLHSNSPGADASSAAARSIVPERSHFKAGESQTFAEPGSRA